jgi:hypothetical protein
VQRRRYKCNDGCIKLKSFFLEQSILYKEMRSDKIIKGIEEIVERRRQAMKEHGGLLRKNERAVREYMMASQKRDEAFQRAYGLGNGNGPSGGEIMNIAEYEEAAKQCELWFEKKYKTKMELEVARKRVRSIQDEFEHKTLCLCIARKEERARMEDKCEPILEHVRKLPAELIQIIRDYLPYSVLVRLMESCRPSVCGLLGRLTSQVVNLYLCKLCCSKEFLTLFSRGEAKCQIKYIRKGGEAILNYPYKPFYDVYSSTNLKIDVARTKVRHLFWLAKERNPAFAYQILSTLHILLKDGAKLRPMYYRFRPLQMKDMPSVSKDYPSHRVFV